MKVKQYRWVKNNKVGQCQYLFPMESRPVSPVTLQNYNAIKETINTIDSGVLPWFT